MILISNNTYSAIKVSLPITISSLHAIIEPEPMKTAGEKIREPLKINQKKHDSYSITG